MRLLILYVLSLFTIPVFANNPVDSKCVAYSYTGRDQFGNFSGQVQVFDNDSAILSTSYDRTWNGYSVQTLHRGQVIHTSVNYFVLEFSLKQHGFITQLNEKQLSKDEFQHVNKLQITVSKKKTNPCHSILDEQDQRQKVEIKNGLDTPYLIQLANSFLIKGVRDWYLRQPELDPYRKSSDFVNKKFYYINDLTDLAFYRRFPKVLRFRNTEINEFTLREVSLRNAAFAYSIDEKIKYFEQNTYKYNINSAGMFDYTIGNERYPDYDSALWTAMYTASQAMKYKVTHDKNAYNYFRQSLRSLVTLVEISDDPESFARGLMPVSSETRISDQWKKGKGRFSKLYWLPGGNNDMIKGLFLGFIWAYKMLDKNDPLYVQVKDTVLRLEQLKLKRLNFINKTYILGLKALFYQSLDSYKDFIHSYLSAQNNLDLLGLDRPFYIDGMSDWSGAHLNMVSNLTLLLIAEEMQKNQNLFFNAYTEFDAINRSSVDVDWIIKKTKENINETYLVMQNTKRDYLCLMNFSINKNRSNSEIRECFASFLETPMFLPDEKLVMDRRFNKDFIYSPSPDLPWKGIFDRQSVDRFLSANIHYPKFEGDGIDSQYMWKDNAFEIMGQKMKNKKMPRVDILFSYWAFRFYENSDSNLISDFDQF